MAVRVGLAALVVLAGVAARATADGPSLQDALKQFDRDFRADSPLEARVAAVKALASTGRPEAVGLLLTGLREVQTAEEDLRQKLGQVVKSLEPLQKDVLYPEEHEQKERLQAEAKQIGERLRAEETVEETIRDGLGGIRDTAGLQALVSRGLSDKSFEIRSLVVSVIGKIGDEKLATNLIPLLDDKDPRVQTAALDVLTRFKTAAAVPSAAAILKRNSTWGVKLCALKLLREVQGKEAIGTLIEALPKEEGRVLGEIVETLQSLTGMPFGGNPASWRDWWAANEKTFKGRDSQKPLPASKPAPQPAAPKPSREGKGKPSSLHGTSYHGITTYSDRVVFVIDISDSMNEGAQSTFINEAGIGDRSGGVRSKFDVAREELKRAILKLTDRDSFDIVAFNHLVTKFNDNLTQANESNKGLALAWIAGLKATGGTNIFDALEAALSLGGFGVNDRYYNSNVDTIFLMTDGAPSHGRLVKPDEILQEVGRMNGLRKVTIHCVGIGKLVDSKFLKELAYQNGGQYVSYD